jgi:hypothetical protein
MTRQSGRKPPARARLKPIYCQQPDEQRSKPLLRLPETAKYRFGE